MRHKNIVIAGVSAAAGIAVAGYTGYQLYLRSTAEATSRDNKAEHTIASTADKPAAAATSTAAKADGTTSAAPADLLKSVLKGNEAWLSAEEGALVQSLLEANQEHLFASWPAPGTDDASKRRLLEQLKGLNQCYHGGLGAYIGNATKLLQDSKEGRNPFDGYTPKVPHGEKLDFASPDFLDLEGQGLKEVAGAAFVLVAGGLGERLGYSGIKVALPCESITGTSFLQLYCHFILALQARCGTSVKLPFAIMTSDDTHARTQALLEKNNYYGMDPKQVTLMKQEKVACLSDNDARLALEPSDAFRVQTKPHGHGDVHALLHSTGLAKDWLKKGLKWVCFFQDTNALVFRALLASLGVSSKHDYDVNSLAVPRRAKEAIGAIALLQHTDGSSMTINVEYNQLDPLLRATVNPEGDVNDSTGYSPYPGNINQLVIKLSTYTKQLEATGGIISEFVNPKYKDSTKTVFKSSTRLECMMQDFPKALPQGSKVGFTTVNQVWASYSPVKNSVADAQAKAKEGNPTHSATTGEMDIYKCNALILQQLVHAQLPSKPPAEHYNAIEVESFPRVVLSPSFAPLLRDVQTKIPGSIKLLTSQSVLVLDGPDIQVSGAVEVDGALVVRAVPGARVTLGPLQVHNKGWSLQPLTEQDKAKEEEQIRGFRLVKHEAKELVFDRPGTYTVGGPVALQADASNSATKTETPASSASASSPATAAPAASPAPAPALTSASPLAAPADSAKGSAAAKPTSTPPDAGSTQQPKASASKPVEAPAAAPHSAALGAGSALLADAPPPAAPAAPAVPAAAKPSGASTATGAAASSTTPASAPAPAGAKTASGGTPVAADPAASAPAVAVGGETASNGEEGEDDGEDDGEDVADAGTSGGGAAGAAKKKKSKKKKAKK